MQSQENTLGMARRTRGLLWTDSEIDFMLKTLYDLKVARTVMTSTNVETSRIFEEVSQKMKEKGYERSFPQIRSKFKREKAYFFDALEEHGGLPPKDLWGPRFHILNLLWIQADRPDFRLRKPAKCGKQKKVNAEQQTSSEEPQQASSTVEQASPSDGTSQNADPNVPLFLAEGRQPTYNELVQEVLSLRTEVSRLKRSQEFMRQGIIRLRDGREEARMAFAVQRQQEESDSDEEDDSDSPSEDEENYPTNKQKRDNSAVEDQNTKETSPIEHTTFIDESNNKT